MTLKFDLKTEQIAIIKDILKACLPKHAKTWLFGSRTKATAKPFSDIDLLIDLGRPLTLEELAALSLAFDESLLPYKVDIADAATISTTFRDAIQGQLVLLQ